MDKELLREYLSKIDPNKALGYSGLAVLCAASLLSFANVLDQSTVVTLSNYLSGLGLNVLASILEDSFKSLLSIPSKNEKVKLEKLAQKLTKNIRRDARLRREIGIYLDNFDAFQIAIEVTKGNPVISNWLLTNIYLDVTQYRNDFEQIRSSIVEVKKLLLEYTKRQSINSIQGRSCHILFADDDIETIGHSFILQLEKEGYIVTVATSASQAIKYLRSGNVIDILITDLIMPLGNESPVTNGDALYTGLSIIEVAREMSESIPILCFSVVTNPEVHAELEKNNCIIIHKPIRPSEFIHHVELAHLSIGAPSRKTAILEEIHLRQIELNSENQFVRIRALWALGEIGHYSPEIIEYLYELKEKESDDEVKATIEKTIEKIRKNILRQLNL